MPLGPKMAPPRGHMFYIGLYSKNMKKSSCLKIIQPKVFIFGIKNAVQRFILFSLKDDEKKKRLKEKARKLISEARESIGRPESNIVRQISNESQLSKTVPASTSRHSTLSLEEAGKCSQLI